MNFFIPAAVDKIQENNVKEYIIKATRDRLETEVASWYYSISFQKEGKLNRAVVGGTTHEVYQVDTEPIIAIVSTRKKMYLIYTLGRGYDGWPPIMVNSSTIVESELFVFPDPIDKS